MLEPLPCHRPQLSPDDELSRPVSTIAALPTDATRLAFSNPVRRPSASMERRSLGSVVRSSSSVSRSEPTTTVLPAANAMRSSSSVATYWKGGSGPDGGTHSPGALAKHKLAREVLLG